MLNILHKMWLTFVALFWGLALIVLMMILEPSPPRQLTQNQRPSYAPSYVYMSEPGRSNFPEPGRPNFPQPRGTVTDCWEFVRGSIDCTTRPQY